MDRRIYILPIVSIIVVVAFLMQPQTTGFIIADSGFSEITADISVTINDGGLIPEDSVVTVYLNDESSDMPFSEFVEKSGTNKMIKNFDIPSISYSGRCYTGIYSYVVPISEFGLGTMAESGEYTIITEVSYGNFVISRDEQVINV